MPTRQTKLKRNAPRLRVIAGGARGCEKNLTTKKAGDVLRDLDTHTEMKVLRVVHGTHLLIESENTLSICVASKEYEAGKQTHYEIMRLVK